jgi:hypothetical protein
MPNAKKPPKTPEYADPYPDPSPTREQISHVIHPTPNAALINHTYTVQAGRYIAKPKS